MPAANAFAEFCQRFGGSSSANNSTNSVRFMFFFLHTGQQLHPNYGGASARSGFRRQVYAYHHGAHREAERFARRVIGGSN
jgi:hypothetical protein